MLSKMPLPMLTKVTKRAIPAPHTLFAVSRSRLTLAYKSLHRSEQKDTGYRNAIPPRHLQLMNNWERRGQDE